MMKQIVTGGAGFIGSHLIDRLVADGVDEIVVIDNMFRGSADRIADHLASRRVTLITGDVRDNDLLGRTFADADTIYHLAAQSNVMGAVSDIGYSFGSNVIGTFNVLQAAATNNVRRVVFTSSREVYGEVRELPVREDHPLDAKNSYGASKAAGEIYCRVFQSTYGLETAIVRLANVYGPRDIGRVIPLWLGWAQKGQPLTVYGGQQVIDFVHVDQVVDALVRVSTADVAGTPINIGSGQGTPILDLAKRVVAAVGSEARLDLQPARSVEVAKFTAEVSRMRALLGMEPAADPLYGLADLAKLDW